MQNNKNNDDDKPTISYPHQNIVQQIVTKSNIFTLVVFFVVYFCLYLLLNISSPTSIVTVSRFFDFFVLGIVAILAVTNMIFLTDNQKESLIKTSVSSFLSYIGNPITPFAILFYLVFFYLVVFFFGIPMDYGNKSFVLSIAETGAWIVFILSVITDVFIYGLQLPLLDYIENAFLSLFTKVIPETIPTTTTITTDASHNEVFHIANNLYSYPEAKSICSTYGASLATPQQVESAYQKGANWISMGWSDNQMALFPAQQSTVDANASNPAMRNIRVGVNGGYIENPDMKFGVNCYGIKPTKTSADEQLQLSMTSSAGVVIPKTPQQQIIDQKVQFYKDNASNLLNISSFDGKKWNASS